MKKLTDFLNRKVIFSLLLVGGIFAKSNGQASGDFIDEETGREFRVSVFNENVDTIIYENKSKDYFKIKDVKKRGPLYLSLWDTNGDGKYDQIDLHTMEGGFGYLFMDVDNDGKFEFQSIAETVDNQYFYSLVSSKKRRKSQKNMCKYLKKIFGKEIILPSVQGKVENKYKFSTF